MKIGLFQQLFKFFDRDGRTFEDGPQGTRLNRLRAMERDDNAAAQILGMGKYCVAAFLAPDDESCLLKRSDHALARNLRKRWNGQAVTSISSKRTSDSGIGTLSSLSDSRYNSMASLALARHSSIVSPCVAQPGRAGTDTEYPPVGSLSSIILNLRSILYNLLDSVKYNLFVDISQVKVLMMLKFL